MTRARVTDKLRLAGVAARPASADFPIAIPRLLVAIHEQRPDLAERFDLDDPEGRAGYVTWCLTEGRNDYRGIVDLARVGVFPGLNEPDPSCATVDPTPVTGLMRLAWRARDDARAAFPLPEAAEAFVWWFVLHGARELGFDDLVGPATRDDLNRPMLPSDDPDTPPITRVMGYLWRVRPDLQAAFGLQLADMRCRYVRWYLTVGVREHDLTWLLTPEQRDWLHAPWLGAPGSGVSNLMGESWSTDPALRERFDLAEPSGAAGLIEWWRTHRVPPPGSSGPVEQAAVRPGNDEAATGVDLFGYTRGELGIGEDVRMLARALATTGVPHAAIDVRPDPSVRQDDRRLDGILAEQPCHRAVVFAMTGVETVRVVATRGFAELRGRYVIGHWPWELPVWPGRWDGAYDLVDEIWTISRFTHDAFAGRAPVPVVIMPPAVELPADHGRWHRSDFGLPENAFLFHFSFDFLSYPHRKNPWACVEAFRRAFPSRREPVGLVVKTMRAEHGSVAWRRLRRAAAEDPRIVLLDRTLSRSETIGLMASTDAYLSLHRAEGFGRGLAEAMLAGLPVIATGYSGTTDFVTEATGFPVDYRLVAVRPGQYPGGEKQHWADPDIDHAAARLRQVYEDADNTRLIAEAGRRHAEQAFSPLAAGARYRERLASLGLLDPDGR
ncbi:glycosyltransferase [Thalassobaculum sp.]|uniref:glycosyltransferase n=1 Tax=Thalassobaculum sp. TaxID=2022740 RepID=UPI0032EFEDE9